MEKVRIHNGGEAEIAVYKDQIVTDYQNNPMIESLPPIYNVKEVIDKLAAYPEYNNEERKLDSHYRLHIVQRLFKCFQPLPFHIDMESRISRAIRQGYITRNPFRPELAEEFNKGFEMINNLNFETTNIVRQTAIGFTIIGISGIGKTCSLDRIMNMYPQIIAHSCYKGVNFSMVQVVWIKLTCPFDSSIKGLCLEFFAEVDRLIGTNYHKKFASTRPATNIMMSALYQITRSIGLGCLIIDEIQHLSLAKSGNMEKMLSFFVVLVNQISIPVILIGTPKAVGVVQSEFRQARRGSGQGDMILDRIINDKTWDLLINGLWKYQWTKKETKLTKELSDVLYMQSQGITDLVKKLYVLSQIKAITSGREEITPAIIKQTANESLKLVQPMLNALRSNDIRKIAQYEDICLMDIDFDGFLNSGKQSLLTNISSTCIKKEPRKNDSEIYKKEQAILKLLDLGVEGKKAQTIVNNIVDNSKGTVDINSIVIQAITFINASDTLQSKSKIKEKEVDPDPEDIRVIVEKGKVEGVTIYRPGREWRRHIRSGRCGRRR